MATRTPDPAPHDVAAVIAGHTQTQTSFTRPTSTLAGSLRHRIALARLAKRQAS